MLGQTVREVPLSGVGRKQELGGIDLNADLMDLEEAGDRIEFQIPSYLDGVDEGMINGIKTNILNITPISNINLLIGKKENQYLFVKNK